MGLSLRILLAIFLIVGSWPYSAAAESAAPIKVAATTLLSEDAFIRIANNAQFSPHALRAVANELNLRAAAYSGRVALITPVNEVVTFNIIDAIPLPEANNFPVDELLAIRFSLPINIDSLNAQTVTLLGPGGAVEIDILISDDGEVAFVRPKRNLFPASRYTLFVSGVLSARGEALPFTAISFSTQTLNPSPTERGAEVRESSEGTQVYKADAAEIDEDETWTPTRINYGAWRTDRALPKEIATLNNELNYQNSLPTALRNNSANVAGLTGISGRVLRLNDRPLDNVTVTVGNLSARTDGNGAFQIAGLPAGRHELVVDGRSANSAGKEYAQFVIGVDVFPGQITGIPLIYLPRVRAKDWVNITSPVQTDTVITHPDLPGLELHVPRGVVLRDRNGQNVTRIALVPIPLDRAPFPVPENFPMYFTVQPGGLTVQGLTPNGPQGIRAIYPNYFGAPPGDDMDFWHYDSRDKGWFVYGQGKVSADGRQVIPNPGVALYETLGVSFYFGSGLPPPEPPPPPPPCPLSGRGAEEKPNPDPGGESGDDADSEDTPPPGPPPCGGDPVHLASGLFIHRATDLVMRDVLSVYLTRTYRPGDLIARPFGRGWTHPFAMYLWSRNPDTNQFYLVLPDGERIWFPRISGGSGIANAVFEHASTISMFHKARVTFANNPARWELKLKSGMIFEFDLYSGHKLIGIRDRYDNRVRLTRTQGRVDRITTPSGRFIDFTYDQFNRITEAHDIAARATVYQYTNPASADGLLWKVTNPEGHTEEYSYFNNRLRTIRDRRGNVALTNEYYESGPDIGRVRQQTMPDTGTYNFSYTNNGVGRITQAEVIDPRNKLRRVSFNESGQMTSDTRGVGTPEAQTASYQYYPSSNLLELVTDARNRRTRFTYDTNGNVLSMTQLHGTADAVRHTYTYANFGKVETYTNPLNKIWRYQYDLQGRLEWSEDPLRHRTRFTYQPSGQIRTVTDALNHTTTYDYDFNDLARITNHLGRTWTRTTDAIGRVTSATDPLGNRTSYEYNRISKLTKVTDARGKETVLTYDQNGNLRTLRDARNGLTEWRYDAKNRLERRIDPLLKPEVFEYDRNNNLTRYTDRKNQAVNFAPYDALNRPTTVTFHDNSTIGVTYDNGNRLRRVVDSVSGTINLDFDELDRLREEITPEGRVNYTFDRADRRETMTVLGQPPMAYTFDDANRLTRITQGANQVIMGYDDADRRTSLSLPNSNRIEYDYDEINQLKEIIYKRGVTTLGNLTYDYDRAGRRIAMNGSFARMNLPAPIGNATYDIANRLTNWNGQTFTYDDNGNLTNDGTRTYSWNVRDQLTQITGPMNATFQYDSFGRRKQKIINSARTDFLYDGWNFVQEKDNATVKANLLTGLGLDELYSRTQGANSSYFLPDALGGALGLADNTGAIQTNYSYAPYGMTTQSGQANENSQKFTGREDDGTGLYHYRFRYYLPTCGRFVSEDPFGVNGGINLYAYVENDPISYTDPTGEIPWIFAPIIGGIIGGGIDLGWQIWQKGWGCVSWGQVGGAAAAGAVFASLGPGGAIFGRSAQQAGKYGGSFPPFRGVFNQGNNRMGWGWNQNTGRQPFGPRSGPPRKGPHGDWFSLPKGDHNLPFGLGGGLAGGGTGVASDYGGAGAGGGCK